VGTTLIVDITDRCNARCRYCRWGDGQTKSRAHRPLAEVCADPAVVRAAGISRAVLSGGEPLLHPDLETIIAHYAECGVVERVVITNGLVATQPRLEGCHHAGATGFAFSVDAVDEDVAKMSRAMSASQVEVILRHLGDAAAMAALHNLELTVNCVLSAANCSVDAIRRLADRCADAGARAIKFQPVFDDGYLGENAPELRLSRAHAEVVRAIGTDSARWRISTNATRFFEDVARLCEGGELDANSCGLGGRVLVLQRGGYVVCPWVGARPGRGPSELGLIQSGYQAATKVCKTGPHCFCLQPPGHSWRFLHANA
jgi:molybdenum cofactor biosynthesis enzyme MoaA